MFISIFTILPLLLFPAVQAARSSAPEPEKHVNTLELAARFAPVLPSEFHHAPHHRRTPFAVSDDGESAWIAYIEGKTKVHVQKVSTDTFEAEGDVITIDGAQEASGLIAHNDDGFALLTHTNTTSTDPTEYFIPTLLRYATNGTLLWNTPLGGKSVLFTMFPSTHIRANQGDNWGNLDGDLVHSSNNGTYAAYFRAGYYGGLADGHGGDSIVYVSDAGDRIAGPYSQTQHCGHNFGLGIAPADDIPFASVCTADDGFVRISSLQGGVGEGQPEIGEERPHEMYAAEAFGGSGGSYSDMARFGERYLVVWVTRPAGKDNEENRAKARYVQVAELRDRGTLGEGPKDVTAYREDTDCFNARVAAFDRERALVTWEESLVEECEPSGCQKSTYTGTRFLVVDSRGEALSETFVSKDVFVSGDIERIGSKLCWPYVDMQWDSTKKSREEYDTMVEKMSFACVDLDGNGNSTTTSAPSPPSSSATSTLLSSATSAAPSSSTSTPPPSSSTSTPPPSSPTSIPPPSSTAPSTSTSSSEANDPPNSLTTSSPSTLTGTATHPGPSSFTTNVVITYTTHITRCG